jgi:hypothetical protein
MDSYRSGYLFGQSFGRDRMPQQKPVIFLAFANDRVNYATYLRNLPTEHRGIRNVLNKAIKAGLCEPKFPIKKIKKPRLWL